MLGRLIRYILLSISYTFSIAGHAQTDVSSIRSKLAEADNYKDSVRLLYNIYDISPDSLKGFALEDIYDVVIRSKDYRMVSDVLKLSSYYHANNESMQRILINRAEKLPDSDIKQSTLAFIRIVSALNKVNTLSREQREEILRDYFVKHTASSEYEKYKRIEYMFMLCIYLRTSTEGELLTNYLKELQSLIDVLPTEEIGLRYLFYKQAADRYLSNGLITEGVSAGKTLLNLIDELKRLYAANGFTFQNYDQFAFLSYSRLLRCHDALTPQEVDNYYNKIVTLVESNPNLKDYLENRVAPKIYYLMANKRYREAMPLLKEQLADDIISGDEKLYVVNALVKAAEAVGDKETLLMALERSNDMLKERIENKATSSYNDLQMIYEVNDLRHTNDELFQANQQIIINRHKEQFTYALTSLIVLMVLLAIVYVLYRRSKKLTTNLSTSNTMIVNERDAIQVAQKDLVEASNKAELAKRMKEDFVSSMGHEIRTPLEFIVEFSEMIANCADIDKREYIKRFSEVITLNSTMLLSRVNHVLDLPPIENDKVGLQIEKSSVQQICLDTIENVRPYIKSGVDLVFVNAGQVDTIIMTDPQRVAQVLFDLLLNAARFTEVGAISLEYSLVTKTNMMVFTVTDTGCGVPKGNEEIIFSNCGRHDMAPDSKSLGLYICRLHAKMLGGNLIFDSEYHSGAKFVFSIPIL